ncbi:hypothetical protein B9Z65_6470 [Elsinoe australis]|uniref:Uncharacterized protein n=1 Tax=Elsinoe australis TaxID=40998 RepID=A0A2P8A8Q3_9PEZI|nr:hypothetical protein B9Z65_6470 [Elsinoe australis]
MAALQQSSQHRQEGLYVQGIRSRMPPRPSDISQWVRADPNGPTWEPEAVRLIHSIMQHYNETDLNTFYPYTHLRDTELNATLTQKLLQWDEVLEQIEKLKLQLTQQEQEEVEERRRTSEMETKDMPDGLIRTIIEEKVEDRLEHLMTIFGFDLRHKKDLSKPLPGEFFKAQKPDDPEDPFPPLWSIEDVKNAIYGYFRDELERIQRGQQAAQSMGRANVRSGGRDDAPEMQAGAIHEQSWGQAGSADVSRNDNAGRIESRATNSAALHIYI